MQPTEAWTRELWRQLKVTWDIYQRTVAIIRVAGNLLSVVPVAAGFAISWWLFKTDHFLWMYAPIMIPCIMLASWLYNRVIDHFTVRERLLLFGMDNLGFIRCIEEMTEQRFAELVIECSERPVDAVVVVRRHYASIYGRW